MAQQFNLAPHSKLNLAVGGLRMMIRDKVENAGWLYVGKIVSPNIAQAIDVVKHYDSSSGKSMLDMNIVAGTSVKFDFSAEEFLLLNLRRFFMSSVPTEVVANATATAVAETFIAGKAGVLHGVKYGHMTAAQRTALAVYNVTTAALMVAGTDYDVVSIYDWTFIRMKVDTRDGNTLRVGTGATAVTAYNYNQVAARTFAPMTKLSFDIEAIVQFPSAQGVNYQWRISSAALLPNGNLNWDAKAASSMPFSMEVLDDSANNPANPYGALEFQGYDDAGAALM